MEDVKFAQALEIDWPYFSKVLNMNKECIQSVADVYSKNMLLVRSIIELLPAFSGIVTRYAGAAQSLTHDVADNIFSTEDLETKKRAEFHAKVEEITNAEEATLKRDLDLAMKHDQMQIRNVVYFLQLYQGDPLESGVRALLQSSIKDAWTAIEVLAEDLLTTVMLNFPSCFHKVIWDKDRGEPRFRSRSGIKVAYQKAFPVDDEKIKEALQSDGIDALALLRNVLVHKGGLADDDFKDGAKDNPLLVALRAFDDRQPLKIDGEIIKAVIEPAARAGCDLLLAVDTWITMAKPY